VNRCRVAPEQIHCFQPPKCCARVVDYSNSPQTHLDRLLHRCVVLTLDGDSYRLRDHQHEPESGGLAYAAHGVAASPAPMPRATANAPMRPMHFAYPMVIPPLPAQPARGWALLA
jgi:hypothetical protein